MSKAPIKVVVSGAAGNIGYAIVPRLLNGEVFGEDQPVALCMLEIPPVLPTLNGVVMELKDCAFACNAGLMATADPNEAMRDADVVVIIGGFPRKKGMLERPNSKEYWYLQIDGRSIKSRQIYVQSTFSSLFTYAFNICVYGHFKTTSPVATVTTTSLLRDD